ncbi:hypothetical protein I547_1021 [Mycobacterium kansasii 824]|uniref:Uncharacterized protein n=1 Tax=Mycobacterium kansasii TaxID=1768 RepID=A0A1V3XSP2_MYCKA|nr:hypothetical protein I547_1021 [Mycobacterium kansasii 824]KEP43524.1 hypothetical protein MKSMC1_13020 [Mycobacterium kansasii]OOK82247.1 hypothetical protein BZL30_1561 [Mycobacterium kansasii]
MAGCPVLAGSRLRLLTVGRVAEIAARVVVDGSSTAWTAISA